MQCKNKSHHAGVLALLLMMCQITAHAAGDKGGISLQSTRLIFKGDSDASSIAVNNSSAKDVWLMRFWISEYSQSEDKKEASAKDIPFAVTPPLYRLDPSSSVQLRVNKLAAALPQDRETVWYLNNLAIPPKAQEKSYQKAIQSGLQFAVNTRIKMFYRPAGLLEPAAVKAAPEKVTLSVSGKELIVTNPTPYYLTFAGETVSGKGVGASKDPMVAPFGTIAFTLPAGVTHGTFSYRVIDDNGAMMPSMTRKPFEKMF